MSESEQFKSGFIGIIGRPNVGKSTLINAIMGEKLVITSGKPQTTRNAIRCIYTTPDCQMVFIDTPGIMRRSRNKLGDYMQKAALDTLSDVDVILYLVEPESSVGPGDQAILKQLREIKVPVILCINKIDTLPRENLLTTMDLYRKAGSFSTIIPLSARSGDGIPELLAEIQGALPQGPQFFPEDMIVDQSERFIVAEIIREKILRLLKDEIPHGVAVEITQMRARQGKNLIDIEATLFCEKKSHKGILIGKNGEMLKRIGTQARTDIAFFLKTPVNLQLWVKVRSDWRDRNFDLKDLGYSD